MTCPFTITQSWTNRDVYGRPLSQMRKVDSVTESPLSLNTGEGPVARLARQGARPVRERVGPPGGMKAQPRPTEANSFVGQPRRTAHAGYAWTADGRLQTVQTRWNGGANRSLHYVYGGTEGALSQIENTSTDAALATFTGRDAEGRATAIGLSGGASIHTQYDLMGRVDWRRKTYAFDHRGASGRHPRCRSCPGSTKEIRPTASP